MRSVVDDGYHRAECSGQHYKEERSLYVEPPFLVHVLENWAIEDESGERKLIDIPSVYDNGEVNWRHF